ncbi:transglycosylase family protein [Mycolicibacter minnesotensis]
MRRFTALAAGALLVGAGAQLPGAANAEPIDWDAIATCASGGNWSAETGVGYGGLQISAADWGDHGGVGLPSQASPQQQIAVAKRIMATRGPGAWPVCASRGAAGGSAPVGSLTHYLTALSDEADGAASD